MTRFLKILLVGAVMIAGGLAWAPGFGVAQQILPHVLLVPSRLVFDGRTRNASITVNNPTAETQTYRLDLLDMTMSEDGEFTMLEPPDAFEFSARDMITFSPRVVTVEAGGAQLVRLLARKPPNLPEGEYRSHLRFLVVPTENDVSAPADEDELNIKIRPIYGVTIPVLVRHGILTVSTRLSNLTFERTGGSGGGPQLSLTMVREGTQSSYGNLEVTYTPAGGQRPVSLAILNRIPVYVPNPTRNVRIDLAPPAGVVLGPGVIRVVYRAILEEGGGLLAEAELPIR